MKTSDSLELLEEYNSRITKHKENWDEVWPKGIKLDGEALDRPAAETKHISLEEALKIAKELK